jgi:KTSC domain
MKMELVAIQSKMLSHVGYDEATKELHITFGKGGSYVYHDVPKEAHEAFMAAESKGKHYLGHIKNNFKTTRKP